jgi:hypothetical protein
MRVARLAAQGRTNREIAQDLYVTLKTIEGHLASAYGKLGITGRPDLPQALESPGDGLGSQLRNAAALLPEKTRVGTLSSSRPDPATIEATVGPQGGRNGSSERSTPPARLRRFRQRGHPHRARTLAEDISWHVPGRSPASGDYAGHAGVLDFSTDAKSDPAEPSR